MNIKEFKSENLDFCISLEKLAGSPVKEVAGYLSMEFGEPVFKLCFIYFQDGTNLDCEGEHDMPYVVETKHSPKNYTQEILQELYDQENEPC